MNIKINSIRYQRNGIWALASMPSRSSTTAAPWSVWWSRDDDDPAYQFGRVLWRDGSERSHHVLARRSLRGCVAPGLPCRERRRFGVQRCGLTFQLAQIHTLGRFER
jgi:hypothetical protein